MPINKEKIEQKTKENIKKQFKEKTNDKIITIKNNKIMAYLKSKYGWNLKKCKDITDELIQYRDILNELYEYTIEKNSLER